MKSQVSRRAGELKFVRRKELADGPTGGIKLEYMYVTVYGVVNTVR